MKFKELGVSDELEKLCERNGWVSATKIQRKTIPILLKNTESVFGIARPKSGKTVGYILAILQQLSPKPLFSACVVCPNQSVMDITDIFRSLGCSSVLPLLEGIDADHQKSAIKEGTYRIVVGSAATILPHIQTLQNLRNLDFLVIDDGGVIFQDEAEYDRILSLLDTIQGDPTIHLFSSVLLQTITDFRGSYFLDSILVETKKKRPDLNDFHVLIPKDLNKTDYLDYFTSQEGKTLIVFTSSDNLAYNIYGYLQASGLEPVLITSSKADDKNLDGLLGFQNGHFSFMVCLDEITHEFGLKLPMADYVIGYDIPKDESVHSVRISYAKDKSVLLVLDVVREKNLLNTLQSDLSREIRVHPPVHHSQWPTRKRQRKK